MKNRQKTNLKNFLPIFICAAFALFALSGTAINNPKNLLDTTAVEISYKAISPIGDFGGTALPASCESNAWNANNGYHLDAVTNDPGNCALATPGPGKCGPASDVETATAPTTGLCQSGNAGAVTGSGPWSWSCSGVVGGKTDSCSAPKQNTVNNRPNRPDISGDLWAIVGKPTANWIVSTDPESDDVYYEVDWNYTSSFNTEGTTGVEASGYNTPIGHIYNSVGTYTVKGRAVQANDISKVSDLGTYTIRVAPSDATCSAPANACGVTGGTVVGGVCVAAGLPAGYGTSCSGDANVCGMRDNRGIIGCSGSCSVTTAPSNTLCSCSSAANSCGMTNSGFYNAAGTACGASTPSEALCVAPIVPIGLKPGVVTINDFRASPKLLAINRTSKLYWDITGNTSSCVISYTKTPGGPAVVALAAVSSNIGKIDTTPISEKRYYHLTCGAVEKEAVVSPYSLTEI